MTDDEIRGLVRDAIARHLGGGQQAAAAAPRTSVPSASTGSSPVPLWRAHPSFGRFLLPRDSEEGGQCVIEPAVACNHCGFCESFGH